MGFIGSLPPPHHFFLSYHRQPANLLTKIYSTFILAFGPAALFFQNFKDLLLNYAAKIYQFNDIELLFLLLLFTFLIFLKLKFV